ncbi:MAG: hypothetical protein AB1478_09775, partial [Nitrospirota bacterium]
MSTQQKFFLFIILLSLPVKLFSMNYGQTIVNIAQQYIGTRYEFGQLENVPSEGVSSSYWIMDPYWTPAKGIDCSGLVSKAAALRRHYSVRIDDLGFRLKQFTISVSWSELQPGDLFMSDTHVMIFKEKVDGGNKAVVIHASSFYKAVVIDTFTRVTLESDYPPYRLKFDDTPPMITVSGVEDGKTYIDPVTITYSATDNIGDAGVNGYVNGTYFASGKTFSADGDYVVMLNAKDWANNSAPTEMINFTIDTTPPGMAKDTKPDKPTETWLGKDNNTVTITWTDTGEEDLSGYYIVWDESPTTEPTTSDIFVPKDVCQLAKTLSDGKWYFHIRSVDKAGNLGLTVHIGPFWIDTIQPTTTDNADDKWHNSDVTVTLTATDTESGSGVKITHYKIDDSEWKEGNTVLVSVSLGDGEHTITYYSEDSAGNKESEKTCTVKIDTTPPEIEPFPEPGSVTGSSYEYIFRMEGKQCCWSYSISKIPRWISFGATVTDKLSGVDEGSVTGRGPESQPTTITSVTCKGGSRSFSFSNPTERMRNMDGYIGGGAYLHGEQSYAVTVSAKDKAGNPSSKTWSFNVGLKKYEQSKPNPDCDKPDDFEGVSCEALLGSSTTQICLYGDPIGITASGLLAENILLLADVGERFEPVDYNFNLSEILPRIKVLIIPSGGLYGLGDVESFRKNLADYVNNGGTIVCFTQQHGYEFSALPATSDKQQVTGYGWNEDQSCQSASVYINEISPVFNGQTNTTLDVNVDGYFTNWPQKGQIGDRGLEIGDVKVLLRRTKNNMPCLIEYTVKGREVEGRQVEGRVIATTLYSDFSYAQGSLSAEERTLIKSLIDYAINPSTPATQSLRKIPYIGVNFTLNTPEQTLIQGQKGLIYANVFNETAEQKTVIVKIAEGHGLVASEPKWEKSWWYEPTES